MGIRSHFGLLVDCQNIHTDDWIVSPDFEQLSRGFVSFGVCLKYAGFVLLRSFVMSRFSFYVISRCCFLRESAGITLRCMKKWRSHPTNPCLSALRRNLSTLLNQMRQEALCFFLFHLINQFYLCICVSVDVCTCVHQGYLWVFEGW